MAIGLGMAGTIWNFYLPYTCLIDALRDMQRTPNERRAIFLGCDVIADRNRSFRLMDYRVVQFIRPSRRHYRDKVRVVCSKYHSSELILSQFRLCQFYFHSGNFPVRVHINSCLEYWCLCCRSRWTGYVNVSCTSAQFSELNCLFRLGKHVWRPSSKASKQYLYLVAYYWDD